MKIKIASAQYPISQHADLQSWKDHIEAWVEKAVFQDAELLVFPEYGSMELVSLMPEEIQKDIHLQIKEMQTFLSDFIHTFSELSHQYNVVIVAPSFPVQVENKFVNRSYVFGINGLAGYQDKFFMTRFENEEWGISSAPKILTVFQADWGSFGIQICYDVEFSIGTHHLVLNGANMLLVPSCTESIRGATRVHIGARARALEGQLYSVVSQTIGEALWSPAVDVNYGYSAYYTTPDKYLPEEGVLETGHPQKAEWHYQVVDMDLISKVRANGQVFNSKDHSNLSLEFKGEKIEVQLVVL